MLSIISLSALSYNSSFVYKDHLGSIYDRVDNVKIFEEHYDAASKEKIFFKDKPDIIILSFEFHLFFLTL